MGVIRKKFGLLTPSKVARLLAQEVENQLAESGLNDEQILALCLEVTKRAAKEKQEYTVMGGYSQEEQLLTAARELLYELDEKDELEALLSLPEHKQKDFLEPSENDLEDAYNVADSIEFVGSEKQITWARDIATKSNESIALVMKSKSINLPTSAKWWIDNRSNIRSALLNL